MSELAELKARRDEVLAELRSIEAESAKGEAKILKAINSQRWYFFQNNQYILMDRDTGLLWPNLNYFAVEVDRNVSPTHYDYDGWRLPTFEDMKKLVFDKTFPFMRGGFYQIKDLQYWNTLEGGISLYNLTSTSSSGNYTLPMSTALIAGTTYAQDIASNNHNYSKRERLKFTLDLFINNNLWPIFTDDEITDLFGRLYITKPELTAKLQELDSQIEPLQAVSTLSSEFDYTALLAKYDTDSIASSVIKYFQALQSWTTQLITMLGDYERAKDDIISQFNTITLTLSKKYTDSPQLTDDENALLRERTAFFRRRLSLGMNTAKTKILAVKTQADDLEDRIDSTDSLAELAAISREDRADFPLVAENTARIITNALLKIEYFESHREFVINAVKILTDWTEDYRAFKTSRYDSLKNICDEDSIKPEVRDKWFTDWQALRLEIERKLQPMLERGLKGDVNTSESEELSIPEQVIAVLEEYKAAVDSFFLDERKGIYQKYVFTQGGELQDKFEAEAELYKRTSKFQSDLQCVIFKCTNPADKIFILSWADSLLDLQIDDVLAFVADNDLQKISAELLDKFSRLKLKNYDTYLSDAKAYGEELARRGKEYNSLMFKMRQDLADGGAE